MYNILYIHIDYIQSIDEMCILKQVPGPEETVPLLQNQSGVITQLEAENRYLRVSTSPELVNMAKIHNMMGLEL